jgi:hypothetical protein
LWPCERTSLAGYPPCSEVEPWPALKARRQRWAELLRLVYQVDVTVCSRCGGEMRIVAFVTEPTVITRILGHLERRGIDARATETPARRERAWATA